MPWHRDERGWNGGVELVHDKERRKEDGGGDPIDGCRKAWPGILLLEPAAKVHIQGSLILSVLRKGILYYD